LTLPFPTGNFCKLNFYHQSKKKKKRKEKKIKENKRKEIQEKRKDHIFGETSLKNFRLCRIEN